jgi:uncharacterized membrane protein HdeD (DUF308 family)
LEQERLEVLKMLEEGRISAGEAAELLVALVPGEEPKAPQLEAADRFQDRWARFWIYPLLAGGAVLVVGALVLALVYASGAARGWLICGWLPLFAGLMVMVLAWATRRSTWLHLRIHGAEAGRRKLALSFPLPLGLAAWVLRLAQPFVPQLQETGVDDLLIALRASSAQGQPFFLDVQDDENGEHIEIYIG